MALPKILRAVVGALCISFALGCDQPTFAEGEVIDLGLVSGKADSLLDVELPELPVGGATVVRVTTPDGLALTLHRISGATAQLSIISRSGADTAFTESKVDGEPTHAIAASTGAVEHEITIHNRGDQPYRGRLQVELSMAAPSAPGSAAAPDVVKVLVGSSAALTSGAFETALHDAIDDGGKFAALGYFSSSGTPQPVIVLEKAGAIEIVSGTGASLLNELNALSAEGWTPRQFEYGNINAGSPAILWLRKGTLYRSYIHTIEDVKNRANSMLTTGWEVVELLQRGAGAPMVAWLQRADGKVEVETAADCYTVEDAIEARIASGSSVLRLRYGGDANSVAWVRKGDQYAALVAESPAALREDLRAHLQDGFSIETLSYAGNGSIVWLTRGTDIDFVAANDVRDLDDALDLPVSEGWVIHSFAHRGSDPVAAILAR